MRRSSLGPETIDQFVALFVASLRDRAVLLSSYGAGEASAACERTASELEDAFRSWWAAGLSVTDASMASGYSPDRLRELVREGRIPDLRAPGEAGAMRLRRSDLPRRPGPAGPSLAVVGLAAQVLLGHR